MKTFYLIISVLLLSVSLQAQNCPIKASDKFNKLTCEDSLFVSNVLRNENATCTPHIALVLDKEIVLTIIKSPAYDIVYFLSRKEGTVTRYVEVYADGRFIDYGPEVN